MSAALTCGGFDLRRAAGGGQRAAGGCGTPACAFLGWIGLWPSGMGTRWSGGGGGGGGGGLDMRRVTHAPFQGEYKADIYFAGEKAKAASISMMHRYHLAVHVAAFWQPECRACLRAPRCLATRRLATRRQLGALQTAGALAAIDRVRGHGELLAGGGRGGGVARRLRSTRQSGGPEARVHAGVALWRVLTRRVRCTASPW